MVSVTIRFFSALFGSLAAFYLTAHGMAEMKLLSPQSIGRVDEFYTLLVQPITSMEIVTQKTMLLVAIALVAQGAAVAMLFRIWDRPPVAMSGQSMPVEYVDNEAVPDRLLTTWEKHQMPSDSREMPEMSLATTAGPSRQAVEAAIRLAVRRQ